MAPSHPPHAIVPVAMHLPGRPEPLRASASLVWSQGNRAGYEFVAMTDEDRLEIEQTMARARQDEVAPLVQSFAVRSRGTR